MADVSINNVSELQAEIIRLRLLKGEQAKAIGERFTGPVAIFQTVGSLFPKSSTKGQDFIGILSRFMLPLALNKTIFRNSNFLVKALVGFLSQKASHFISEESVLGFWDKIKTMFDKTDKHVDYGIPPESEAS